MIPDPKAYSGIRIIEKPTMRVGGISRGNSRLFIGMFRQANDGKKSMLEGFSEVDSFNRSNGTAIRIIPPILADIALRTDGFSGMLGACSPFPTSTLIGFEKPGNMLGQEIIFSHGEGKRIILPTGHFRGAGSKGLALTVANLDSGDFKNDGNDVRVDVPDERLRPHPGFPDSSGWHRLADGEVAPSDAAGAGSRMSRFLFRSESAYVGPACRGINSRGAGWNMLFMYLAPSFESGTVVEVPEADMLKFAVADIIGHFAAASDEPPSLHELIAICMRRSGVERP